MIFEKLQKDFLKALKDKDYEKLNVLRLINSAVKNYQIENLKKDKSVTDEEMVTVLRRQIKQRKDSIEQYRKGGREDLAKKESAEVEILMGYLPPTISDKEIEKIVELKIEELGAQRPEDAGQVMKYVMAELKGKADGSQVKKIVDSKLKK